uniref:Ig-like domain-containing protein n=1 Tax=Nothobranchius furzeri TaxID=105023 RepID=A0A8C6KFS4_NOTFU
MIIFFTQSCAADPVIERKSIKVGDRVKMECSRRSAGDLHWMKIAFKNPPEYLEEPLDERLYSHIKVNAEPGTFQLQIINAKLNDSALYVCVRKHQGGITYLKLTYLMVEDLAVTTHTVSDLNRPGDPVTLQCSVFSDSDKKTCSEDLRVFWFRAKSDTSYPDMIYSKGTHPNQCEKKSQNRCVSSMNFSTSDPATYYCAVATCGQIIFGNGTKVDLQEIFFLCKINSCKSIDLFTPV